MPPEATAHSPPIESEPHEAYRAGALVSLLQLHWFIRLRWLIVAAALAALAIESFLVPGARRPLPVLAVVLLVGAVNALWMAASRVLLARRLSDESPSARPKLRALPFANAQVAVDLLLLTLILRFTGGVENPMAVFYLFHMAIGSLLLKAWHAIVHGIWAVALYSTITLGEWSGWLQPHYELLPWLDGTEQYLQIDYVMVAIGVVACAVFGTLGFTLHIAMRLDERESQLRRANAALRQSQIAIQDLQKRRSRFMQTAAHQLKTPLAAIQTLVGLLRDGVVAPEASGPTFDRIVARCRDGIHQVTELLTFARVQEADPFRHHRSRTDVSQTLVELRQQFEPLAQQKRIELSFSWPAAADLRAHVDPSDIFNCLANLLDNAIKYTPEGGRVTVRAERGNPPDLSGGTAHLVLAGRIPRDLGEFIMVSVVDTGMGIEASGFGDSGAGDSGESIFDAFRRGNGALAAGIAGTGLGLAIVREVVEQAGGRIQVVSQPGSGSTFTVTFPALRPVAEMPQVRNTRVSEFIVRNTSTTGAGSVRAADKEPNHAG